MDSKKSKAKGKAKAKSRRGLRSRSRQRSGRRAGRDTEKDDEKKYFSITTFWDWVATVQPAALLNLAADTLHNFTDGLAIAAASRSGYRNLVAMILAVAMHELPHEVGDFAVLIQNGFSPNGAF